MISNFLSIMWVIFCTDSSSREKRQKSKVRHDDHCDQNFTLCKARCRVHMHVKNFHFTFYRDDHSIHGHGIFFMGVGLYYISQIFGRGGQFFWGNFRILLHFYYQIFSKNLGWGVCHLGGSTFGRGGKAIETRGIPPIPTYERYLDI